MMVAISCVLAMGRTEDEDKDRWEIKLRQGDGFASSCRLTRKP
ncbi:MAG: hypothetical protein ACOZFS_08645 [Thermodesulfobacteriota bacterium]